jgi:hypothetical protein
VVIVAEHVEFRPEFKKEPEAGEETEDDKIAIPF